MISGLPRLLMGISGVLAFLIVLRYFFALHQFLKSLKESDPEKWSQLGGPTVSLSVSSTTALNTVTFLLNSDFSELPESVAARGKLARRWLVVSFAASFFAVMVMLWAPQIASN